MPSTYANNLRLENIADNDQLRTWGDTTNKNVCSLLVDAITATTQIAVAGSGNYTLSANNGAADEARSAVLRFIGIRTADCTVTAPAVAKTYIIDNYTDQPLGSKNIIIKTATGVGATVPFGKYTVYCDGLDFFLTGFSANGGVVNGDAATTGNFTVTTNLTVLNRTVLKSTLTGALVGTAGVVSAIVPSTKGNLLASTGTVWASTTTNIVNSISGGTTGLTPATPTSGPVVIAGTLATANGGTGATTATGTGVVVLSNSPTLVTPDLGTPSVLVGTNITGSANALNAGLGTNQNWSAPVRSWSTWYYNTTGKAIGLSIGSGASVNGSTAYIQVKDLAGVLHYVIANNIYSNSDSSFAIVPAGFGYQVFSTYGGVPIFWYELS